MNKKIADITSTFALGNPFQKKLLRVALGEQSGRLAALIQTSPTDIELSWSDSPLTVWSALSTLVDDAADSVFDALIDPDGNIHLVYLEETTYYLVTKKLTLESTGWSVGSKVSIFTGDACQEPSLAITPDGTLWVTWRQPDSPNATIQVKSSTDNGATWGTGPTDSGTELFDGAILTWARLIVDGSAVRVIRVEQQSGIQIRSMPLSGGSWSSAETVVSGGSLSQNFDLAVGSDGRIGLVYNQDGLFYREFDGNNWGAIVSVDEASAVCPQLIFENNIPVIVYLQPFSDTARIPVYSERKSGTFSSPKVLSGSVKQLDSVMLFSSSAGTYEDLAGEAESSTEADVYHSTTSCLIKDAGDMVYLGLDEPFRYLGILLSTAGAGGTVMYSYWDGNNWQTFVPASGSNHLTSQGNDIVLWIDKSSIPVDWQKATVNSDHRFWIRLECVSTYSTGPIGTQLSAVPSLDRIILRR